MRLAQAAGATLLELRLDHLSSAELGPGGLVEALEELLAARPLPVIVTHRQHITFCNSTLQPHILT